MRTCWDSVIAALNKCQRRRGLCMYRCIERTRKGQHAEFVAWPWSKSSRNQRLFTRNPERSHPEGRCQFPYLEMVGPKVKWLYADLTRGILQAMYLRTPTE